MSNIEGLTPDAKSRRVDLPVPNPGVVGQPAPGQPEHRAPQATRGKGAQRDLKATSI